jgi:hypothetical protein
MNNDLIYQMGSLLEDLETVVSEMKSIKPNIEDLHWFRLCLYDLDVIIVSMEHIERNINES